MKPVKSFEEFRKELHESRQINEGILDRIKNTLKKIGNYFSGTGSKFLNALQWQTEGKLPKGVKIYPNTADLVVLKANDEPVKLPEPLPESYNIIDTDVDVVNEDEELNEAKITLEHPGDVDDVNTKELKRELETQIRASKAGRKPIPMLIWGAPGIGKTAIIEQVSKFHDISLGNNRLIVIDLATMAPEDFFLPAAKGGVAKDWTPDTKSTRLPIEYLPLFDVRQGAEGDATANGVDGAGGIIFFDEIARCSPSVQDVCLKLCDDSRRVGNFELGSKWTIICAANRGGDESDESKTYSFSSTLGNRFNQMNFVPSYEEWAEWASSATDEEGDILVTPEIIAFLTFYNKEYWHNIDPDALDNTQQKTTIFPTPRTWTNASKRIKDAMKTAKEIGEDYSLEDMKKTVSKFVGKKAANQLYAFLQLMQKVRPEDIAKVYTDPKNAKTLKGLDLGEQNGLIGAVLVPKAKVELSDKEVENFAKWVVLCDDERQAMRVLTQFLAFHPEYSTEATKKKAGGNIDSITSAQKKKLEFWENDILNMIFDAYPNLSAKKTQLD